EEGPVASYESDAFAAALGNQDLFAIVAGARDDFAERIGDERAAPELDAALEADTVGSGDETAVGDRVRAMHRLPGGILRRAVLRLLARVPADRRRIEEDLGA